MIGFIKDIFALLSVSTFFVSIFIWVEIITKIASI